MYKGLDLSIIQSAANFPAIKQSGIDFVICRGYVGNNALDADYNNFVNYAGAAGLAVGTYHFVFPLPGNGTRTPDWQAHTHFNSCKTPLACIDVEWPTSDQWQKWGCSAKQINDWCLSYLEIYSGLAGRKPLVYTYPNFAQTVGFTDDWAQYGLWIASYQPTPFIPKPWTDWVIWQTTGGGGHLPNGAPVDTDVCNDLSIFQ
jgi:lysozyme